MKISIIGAGHFGRAMATHLRRLNHSVHYEIQEQTKLVIVATPSYAVVPALFELKDQIQNKSIVICSKGFAEGGILMSEALKKHFANNLFFLYGPALADGIRHGDLSAMVLAGNGDTESIVKVMQSPSLRIETSSDVVGVQVGAALKNVVTMFIGVAKGAGYSGNTQAYIFTKGLQEVQRIGKALGAKPDTFMGLSCVGDLTLYSRNRRLGVKLGKGHKLPDIITEMGYAPEGIAALKNAKIIAKRSNIRAPFIDDLYSLVFEGKTVAKAIEDVK
jgi:glycerol-3-phosphate dehydrogenase (NAD(P)+)